MATVPPIEAKVMWDGTEFKAGTLEAESDVERMADAVDLAADQMRASLSSIDDGVSNTFGPSGSFDTAAGDIESTGGARMAEAGSEVASEFGSNLAEGIASGDTSATVIDSVTGLGATIASAGGVLAFTGIGALIGGALVSGIVNKAKASAQAITDSVNTAFEAIEIKAKTTNAEIRRQFEQTATITGLYTELGGEGGPEAGFLKLAEYADDFGASAEDAANLINGEMTPGAKFLQEQIKLAGDNAEELATQTANGDVFLSKQTVNASALNKLIEAENASRARTLALAQSTRDGLADQKVEQDKLNPVAADHADTAERSADATERSAAAMERMQRAAYGIGEGLGSAARSAASIALDLGT